MRDLSQNENGRFDQHHPGRQTNDANPMDCADRTTPNRDASARLAIAQNANTPLEYGPENGSSTP
jgi:hypothetical protein